MKLAILLLSLWALSALPAIPAPAVPAPAAPAVAPPPVAAPGAAPAAAPAAATPAGTTPPAKAPLVAPADLVASKYKVSFKLANVKYDEGLLAYDSGLYQNYAGKILRALMNLYADDDSYRDAQMIGFRNDSGAIADVVLRFGNESKNLVSLDALVKTGMIGDLPVDPASLKAEKDVSVPPIVGFGCGSPCGAPQACAPQCTQSCCGGSSPSSQYMPQMIPPFGAGAMPPPMGGSQCPGACPSSCAPSCDSNCCGSSNPMPVLG